MVSQPIFYGLALIGAWLNHKQKQGSIITTIPFYFVSMNAALFIGMMKSLMGNSPATWERVERTA